MIIQEKFMKMTDEELDTFTGMCMDIIAYEKTPQTIPAIIEAIKEKQYRFLQTLNEEIQWERPAVSF